MQVIYSEVHQGHHPPFQLLSTGLREATEVPERVDRILAAVGEAGGLSIVNPREFGRGPIRAVHEDAYLHFLEHAHSSWEAPEETGHLGIIPDTFAMGSLTGKPEPIWRQAGYFCFETQTPIVAGTFEAALSAAQCALTGGALLAEGEPAAYALCRPPGHHAAGNLYGGYCYLNNAAIAAQALGRAGKTAILDVDYHHGNGTQAIFYDSDAVLFVSIHADPNRAYPFFSGFEEERGEGRGRGMNRNFPLGEDVNGSDYLAVLGDALEMISQFDPAFLVVSLGVDIYQEDPLGDFDVPLEVFADIGREIRQMNRPTLFVQEGGYHLDAMGLCVVQVLTGFEVRI
ncbi:MAG: histone deacetylase family protein [bacterium]|nr:histone deacetylase family protein [bacterium]